MKNRLLLLVSFFVFAVSLPAQDLFYVDYAWDSLQIPKDVEEDKVVLLKKKVIEFVHEDNSFVEYDLYHCAELLNSDKEIEKNNKLYIPYREAAEVIQPKARVILPSGKIIEMDESKMLESVDEKTEQRYKFFAFEGLEKGSVIEYMYVVKQYGKEVVKLFEEVKDIFDPNNIFNPGKKVRGDIKYSMSHIKAK